MTLPCITMLICANCYFFVLSYVIFSLRVERLDRCRNLEIKNLTCTIENHKVCLREHYKRISELEKYISAVDSSRMHINPSLQKK